MRKAITAFSVLCFSIIAITLSATTCSAAQQNIPSQTAQSYASGLLKKATYRSRRYCVRQYFACRDRWGDGHRFEQCMRWRDCWDAYIRFRKRHDADDDEDDENDEDNCDDDDDVCGGNSEGKSCWHWRNACAQNWGYGNSDYYGCLRFHGCE